MQALSMTRSGNTPSLGHLRWRPEEDQVLIDHVKERGTRQWKLLLESGKLPGRDNKACCNRFRILRNRLPEDSQGSPEGWRTHLPATSPGDHATTPKPSAPFGAPKGRMHPAGESASLGPDAPAEESLLQTGPTSGSPSSQAQEGNSNESPWPKPLPKGRAREGKGLAAESSPKSLRQTEGSGGAPFSRKTQASCQEFSCGMPGPPAKRVKLVSSQHTLPQSTTFLLSLEHATVNTPSARTTAQAKLPEGAGQVQQGHQLTPLQQAMVTGSDPVGPTVQDLKCAGSEGDQIMAIMNSPAAAQLLMAASKLRNATMVEKKRVCSGDNAALCPLLGEPWPSMPVPAHTHPLAQNWAGQVNQPPTAAAAACGFKERAGDLRSPDPLQEVTDLLQLSLSETQSMDPSVVAAMLEGPAIFPLLQTHVTGSRGFKQHLPPGSSEDAQPDSTDKKTADLCNDMLMEMFFLSQSSSLLPEGFTIKHAENADHVHQLEWKHSQQHEQNQQQQERQKQQQQWYPEEGPFTSLDKLHLPETLGTRGALQRGSHIFSSEAANACNPTDMPRVKESISGMADAAKATLTKPSAECQLVLPPRLEDPTGQDSHFRSPTLTGATSSFLSQELSQGNRYSELIKSQSAAFQSKQDAGVSDLELLVERVISRF